MANMTHNTIVVQNRRLMKLLLGLIGFLVVVSVVTIIAKG